MAVIPKVVEKVPSITAIDHIPPEVLVSIAKLVEQSLVSNRVDRPRLDRTKIRCFRCQEQGHYASECTAPTPVYRSSRQASIEEIDAPGTEGN